MKKDTFKVPIDQRYFEDYVQGSVHEFGSLTVSQEDIIGFAEHFDPQPFHMDPVRAKDTVYEGLIASGWHTGSLSMRLFVDYYLPVSASLGSPGLDELKWIKPVRPNDELSIRVTVLEARRSSSKPDRGVIRSYVEVLNQDREIVMTMTPVNLMLCRPA